VTDLAYSKNIVNIQALEQRPHSEIDVYETAAKVQATGEASDDFEVRVVSLRGVGRGIGEDGRGRSIKLDEITGTWSRMSQYFRDLQGV